MHPPYMLQICFHACCACALAPRAWKRALGPPRCPLSHSLAPLTFLVSSLMSEQSSCPEMAQSAPGARDPAILRSSTQRRPGGPLQSSMPDDEAQWNPINMPPRSLSAPLLTSAAAAAADVRRAHSTHRTSANSVQARRRSRLRQQWAAHATHAWQQTAQARAGCARPVPFRRRPALSSHNLAGAGETATVYTGTCRQFAHDTR